MSSFSLSFYQLTHLTFDFLSVDRHGVRGSVSLPRQHHPHHQRNHPQPPGKNMGESMSVRRSKSRSKSKSQDKDKDKDKSNEE